MGLGPKSHFADLGSGTGKVVLQAIEANRVEHAVGIELARSRHLVATKMLAHHSVSDTQATLIHGDMADDTLWTTDGPLSQITDVFMCSLLYGPSLMQRMRNRLADSQVRQVATLRRFDDGLPGFEEDTLPEPCEMSWMMRAEQAEAGYYFGRGIEANRNAALLNQQDPSRGLQEVYIYQRPRPASR